MTLFTHQIIYRKDYHPLYLILLQGMMCKKVHSRKLSRSECNTWYNKNKYILKFLILIHLGLICIVRTMVVLLVSISEIILITLINLSKKENIILR
jgi:hypothetical protein